MSANRYLLGIGLALAGLVVYLFSLEDGDVGPKWVALGLAVTGGLLALSKYLGRNKDTNRLS